MAKFTRKEFAVMCHTSAGVVGMNIKRGKIIEEQDEDGPFIDSKHPKNKAFFDRYYRKNQAEKMSSSEAKKPLSSTIKKTTISVAKKQMDKAIKKLESEVEKPTRKKRKSTIPKTTSNEEYLEELEWESRKKKADTLLQEAKAEKERLTVEKLAGQLLPIDLVLDIMQTHNREIFATFQNDTENLASIYCDILAAGNRKKLSEVNKKLAEKLEDTIRRSGEVAQASIENLVEMYRQTRSRGERK